MAYVAYIAPWLSSVARQVRYICYSIVAAVLSGVQALAGKKVYLRLQQAAVMKQTTPGQAQLSHLSLTWGRLLHDSSLTQHYCSNCQIVSHARSTAAVKSCEKHTSQCYYCKIYRA
jgi:hypothetical protein